jgi:esterase/lipase
MRGVAMVRSHWSLDLILGRRLSAFGVLWRAAVLYLGLATALPTSVRSLGPHSKAARDYAAAMQLAKAFRRADTAAATDGESIILVHGTRTPRAMVLFHGLTNSPRQFRELAAALYDGGANVFVPRLPQHALRGANADDLGRLTAEALRDVGDAAIDLASGLGDTVVVLGLSLGGDVAAWTAQFRPEVYRAVIVAPTLGLAHISSTVATPMMNLTLRVPNYSKNYPRDSLRPDRTLGWSTHAVGQMLRLGAAVRRAADKRAPAARDIRVLVNAADRTVSRDAIDELAAHWSATGGRVSMFEFPDSLRLPHDVIDPDKLTGNTSVVYPVLLALLYGSTPPANLARRLLPRRIANNGYYGATRAPRLAAAGSLSITCSLATPAHPHADLRGPAGYHDSLHAEVDADSR